MPETPGNGALEAITVAQGLARSAEEQLAATVARARGFTAFTATVLGENRTALHLVRAVSHDAQISLASGEYGVYAPLRNDTAPPPARSRVR